MLLPILPYVSLCNQQPDDFPLDFRDHFIIKPNIASSSHFLANKSFFTHSTAPLGYILPQKKPIVQPIFDDVHKARLHAKPFEQITSPQCDTLDSLSPVDCGLK